MMLINPRELWVMAFLLFSILTFGVAMMYVILGKLVLALIFSLPIAGFLILCVLQITAHDKAIEELEKY